MAYDQARNRKRRLERTYKQIKDQNSHYSGSGVWYDEDRGFYYRYTCSNTPGYARSLRRISNKRVRKSSMLLNHGEYRRLYDYKWALC